MTIPIKNKDGIAKMREACAIAATVLEQLKPLVRPGITTQDLEEAGRDFIARLGARSACYGYQHGSRRYPAHTCISVNDEVVHGIPSFRRILRDGDIVSLDIVVWHDGYVGDNAFTVPVGPISPAVEKLLRVTREALDLGIRAGAGRQSHRRHLARDPGVRRSERLQRRPRHGRPRGRGLDARAAGDPELRTQGHRRQNQARHDPRDRADGQPRRLQDEDALRWLDDRHGRRFALRPLRTHRAHHRARPRNPHPPAPRPRSSFL